MTTILPRLELLFRAAGLALTLYAGAIAELTRLRR